MMPAKLSTNPVLRARLTPELHQSPAHSEIPVRSEVTARSQLLHHLHRGGVYSHLWTDVGNRSHWFHVNGSSTASERTIPPTWQRNNVYFAVHPLSQIPPHNSSGNRDPNYISSQLPYIAAVNALFAEYDGKDYVWPWEYAHYLPENLYMLNPVERKRAIKKAKEEAFYRSPQKYKERALFKINELFYPASVVIDSGGGYHCYWLLRQPVPVDECNRSDLQVLQHAWVRMVAADSGAADLRRVLRMPGTLNMKAGFGKHPPKVHFVRSDFDRLYDLQELEEAINDWLFSQRPPETSRPFLRISRQSENSDNKDARAAFNARTSLVDLLVKHGYVVSFRSSAGTRLSRPGREKSHSSITVFPARSDGTPEISVHFSSNDELYSEEYVDKSSGQIRRHAHDAFYVYVMLECGGDWQKAYEGPKQEAELL